MSGRKTNSQIVMLRGEQAVMEEVKANCKLMNLTDEKFIRFKDVFSDIILLFNGKYLGYRKCNTPYHNLQHTLDCLLAMVRLIHGAHIDGLRFSEDKIVLALISAVLHDTGYIQTEEDINGTGAKYTMIHVRRSIDFAEKYLLSNGFSNKEFIFCRSCIRYTALDKEYSNILFENDMDQLLGRMLATADLVGQMADVLYLERLSLLAKEFEEAKVPGFKSEADLMHKTLSFHIESRERFYNEFGNAVRYLKIHFNARWQINSDLYTLYINKQMRYLAFVMDKYPDNYCKYLNRKRLEE